MMPSGAMVLAGGKDGGVNGKDGLVKSEKKKDGNEWTDKAVELLLELYEHKWRGVSFGNLRVKDWEHVASSMDERYHWQGERKTFLQCKNKIENLKKRYKLEREKKNEAGELASDWPWFPRLHEIIGKAPKQAGAMVEEVEGGLMPVALGSAVESPDADKEYEGEGQAGVGLGVGSTIGGTVVGAGLLGGGLLGGLILGAGGVGGGVTGIPGGNVGGGTLGAGLLPNGSPGLLPNGSPVGGGGGGAHMLGIVPIANGDDGRIKALTESQISNERARSFMETPPDKDRKQSSTGGFGNRCIGSVPEVSGKSRKRRRNVSIRSPVKELAASFSNFVNAMAKLEVERLQMLRELITSNGSSGSSRKRPRTTPPALSDSDQCRWCSTLAMSSAPGRDVIHQKLMKALTPTKLEVEDVSVEHVDGLQLGAGKTHFNVRIVSPAFEGKSQLQRHRSVYQVLQDELKGGMHAVSIVARTPIEAASTV